VASLCAVFFVACGGETTTNTGNTGGVVAGNRNQAPAPANQNTAPAPANSNQAATSAAGKNPVAVLDTDAGTIKIELLANEAPQTAENFRQLAQSGFYNNLIFHRVVKGFMIQGGDPQGTGAGGRTASGQPLPNEVKINSPLYQGGYKRGAVAMANKGGDPRTGSSQFFIMHQNYPLQPQYTIFGRVIEGMETVDKIASAPVNGERPATPVKMKSVTIQ
jgi:cyclophilin family peptidyl-prolyl cis-trans isomerase